MKKVKEEEKKAKKKEKEKAKKAKAKEKEKAKKAKAKEKGSNSSRIKPKASDKKGLCEIY